MCKGVLLVVLLVLARCLLVWSDEDGFCSRSVSISITAGFEQGTRRLPPRTPALAAFDWDMSTTSDQQQLVGNYTPCHTAAPIFRYKVVKRVIYADHDDSDPRYKPYRDVFLEQLVLAMWVYSDFPDVDLVVDYTDHPQLCDQRIPFLRFSIFNASALGPLQQQQHYSVTELLAPGWVTQEYVRRLAEAATSSSSSQITVGHQQAPHVLPYTRGFTIPTPEAWRGLSLTPVQLQEYLDCLQETHPWESRRHVIFWRGQATGCSRGWPQLIGTPRSGEGPAKQPHLLRNKRIQMALRLFPYPHAFDVGITSIPRLTLDCLGASSEPDKHKQHSDFDGAGLLAGGHVHDVPGNGDTAGTNLHANPVLLARAYSSVGYLLHKQPVGMEGWADAVATISIDGYGPAYRLPQQLLLPAVVLKQASPYQTWLDWVLHPGVHFKQFAYDLSDLELAGLRLVAAGHSDIAGSSSTVPTGSRVLENLQRMADAARTAVRAKISVFAQLDAFAWSVARYKEVTPWEVEVPGARDTTWRILQLDPISVFNSQGVSASVRLQVMRFLKANFEVALRRPAHATHMMEQQQWQP